MALKADVVNSTLDSNSGTTGRFRWLLESHCVTAATTPSLPYIAVADDVMLVREGIARLLYDAGIDQTTLRPSVDVEYVLLKDGREVGKQVEDWHGTTSGDRLTLARLIDSRGLSQGDYAIEVRARDRVSGAALEQTAKFKIVQ